MAHRVLVVGAGFSGAVVARELADTGMLGHRYGPRIINISIEAFLNYVQLYGT